MVTEYVKLPEASRQGAGPVPLTVLKAGFPPDRAALSYDEALSYYEAARALKNAAGLGRAGRRDPGSRPGKGLSDVPGPGAARAERRSRQDRQGGPFHLSDTAVPVLGAGPQQRSGQVMITLRQRPLITLRKRSGSWYTDRCSNQIQRQEP